MENCGALGNENLLTYYTGNSITGSFINIETIVHGQILPLLFFKNSLDGQTCVKNVEFYAAEMQHILTTNTWDLPQVSDFEFECEIDQNADVCISLLNGVYFYTAPGIEMMRLGNIFLLFEAHISF